MISLSISQRVAGKWVPVDLAQYPDGGSLLAAMNEMHNHEFVAEWKNGEATAMACGMEKQAKAYRDKGVRVLTFPGLAAGLQSKDYQDRLIGITRDPALFKAQELFGVVISSVELAENREERVAIMTVEGMSEEDAQNYCDTKPSDFGTRETS